MRPGTCFAGWREGAVSSFLLSPLPSEIGDLSVRISTLGTRKSTQGPNMESRAAGGQQLSSVCSSEAGASHSHSERSSVCSSEAGASHSHSERSSVCSSEAGASHSHSERSSVCSSGAGASHSHRTVFCMSE